jgi:diguanylate cyclase (GGDEF)-like protein
MSIRGSSKGRKLPWAFQWNQAHERSYTQQRQFRIADFLARFGLALPVVVSLFALKQLLLDETWNPNVMLVRGALILSGLIVWGILCMPRTQKYSLHILFAFACFFQVGLLAVNYFLPDGFITGMPGMMLMPIIVAVAAPNIRWLMLSILITVVPVWIAGVWFTKDTAHMVHLITWSSLSAISAAFLHSFANTLFRKNYQLATELKRIAYLDALTLLPNRRAFFSHLPMVELPRAASSCVIYCDIDHFKKINDEKGHDEGDEILQIYGRFLADKKEQYPNDDMIVARIGGEEFAIWLPDKDAGAGADYATQLLVETRELGITASFGVAPLLVNEEIDIGLRRADIALYNAKSKGRNRVELSI